LLSREFEEPVLRSRKQEQSFAMDVKRVYVVIGPAEKYGRPAGD
jgi:hypothetical protein